MTAQIIYLADVRARRARIEIAFTFDPLVLWRSWWDFLAGGRTK